ncbi:MAG: hypothetical protein M3Q81_04555 [bacterium]|nr:hypothetical protein [bacterium]
MKILNPLWLPVTWLIFGCIVMIAGLFGWLYPVLAIGLLVIVIQLALTTHRLSKTLPSFSLRQLLLIGTVLSIWLLHSLQLFVPETGFDAVWYHLPVAEAFATAHRYSYLPDLYQSLNPLFSDGLFYPGYMVAHDFGAKVTAYLLGLSLLVVVYQLSRYYMTRSWALVTTIIISLFQVITWQVSSFYVDIPKALWELSALWLLIDKNVLRGKPLHRSLLIGLCIGASLATKQFSLLLLPLFMALYIGSDYFMKQKKLLLTVALGMMAVFMPLYLRSWYYSGSPFFMVDTHVSNIIQTDHQQTLVEYLIVRTLLLPTAPYELLAARDYVSIIPVVLLPLTMLFLFRRQRNTSIIYLTIFTVWQLMIWWFVPPPSTRYALAGFITLVVLTTAAASYWYQQKKELRAPIVLVLMIGILWAVLPRLVVANRSLSFILGHQTKQEYIELLYDGMIDHHLKSWHSL